MDFDMFDCGYFSGQAQNMDLESMLMEMESLQEFQPTDGVSSNSTSSITPSPSPPPHSPSYPDTMSPPPPPPLNQQQQPPTSLQHDALQSNFTPSSDYLCGGGGIGSANYCGGGGSAAAAAMREIMFQLTALQPVYIDPEEVKAPKRRNVKISKEPQSVAARHRRERISERIRILQRMVPGGTKMDTASMLDEAVHYVKYLKTQVEALKMAVGSGSGAASWCHAAAAAAGAHQYPLLPPPVPSSYNHHHQYVDYGSSNYPGNVYGCQMYDIDLHAQYVDSAQMLG